MTALVTAAADGALTGVVVREARQDEWPAVGELTRAAYAEAGLGDASYHERLRDAADRGRQARLLVAVDEGDVLLGTVTVARTGLPYADVARPGETEFRMLAVARTAQRRGVGALLVRACATLAGQAGDARLVCSVEETNDAGLALYRRLGFARQPERDWDPVPGITLLVLGRAAGHPDA